MNNKKKLYLKNKTKKNKKSKKQNKKIENLIDYNQKGGISELFNVDIIFDNAEVYKKIKEKFYCQDVHIRPSPYLREWQENNRLYESGLIVSIKNLLDKYDIKIYLGLENQYQYFDINSRLIIYTNKNLAILTSNRTSLSATDVNVVFYVYNDPNNVFTNFKKAYETTYRDGKLYDRNKISVFEHIDVADLYDYINPRIYADYMTLMTENEIMEIVDPKINDHEKFEEEELHKKYNELSEEYIKLNDNFKSSLKKFNDLYEENQSLKKDILKYYPKTPIAKKTPAIV